MDLLRCKDDAERGRLLDVSRRLRPVELRGSILFGIAAIVGGPSFGWFGALPPLPGFVAFWVLQRRLSRFRLPELVLLACLVATEGGLAGSLVLAHGPRVYLLSLFLAVELLGCIAFPTRLGLLTIAFSGLLVLAVGLGADRAAVLHQPFMLLYPLAVVMAGGWVAIVASSLDMATRGVATLDQLTGLPNRLALRARAAELEHQTRAGGRPVAVLVADPDHFKAINDSHGHAVGDEVLRRVAATLREAVPLGGAAYRLGGEEFVVLLADTDAKAATVVAEEVARRIAAQPLAGVPLTISVGVSASGAGAPFSFSEQFGRADRALYELKQRGGNGVCVSRGDGQLELKEVRQEQPIGAAAAAAHRPAREELPRPALDQSWASWTARQERATGNWLVRDELQRRQLLALNRRLRERAWPAFLVCFAVGTASAVEFGWQILALPAAMTAVYITTEHRLDRLQRPEFALGLAWLGLQTGFMASGLVASHEMVFAAPLLFMLLIGSSAVFPPRGVAIGVAYTVGIIVLSGLVEDPRLIEGVPALLCFISATPAVIGMLGVALGRSTIQYRDLAIEDQLTGLFNRAALALRVAELEHRSAASGEPVSLLVLDIDRFKTINDSHGHAVGDAVLRELGVRLRRNLRAFESAYRIGGEEFLVVLEGVDGARAEEVGERLCQAVAQAPLAGIPVTVSVGVCGGKQGAVFRYNTAFSQADLALYKAKRSGGNRAWAVDVKGAGAASPELAPHPVGPQAAAA